LASNGGMSAFRVKKLQLAQSYLLGRPVLATWSLSRCGRADCVMCEHSAEAGIDWVSVADAERVSAALGRVSRLVVRVIGGADPFLHPDLPGIVRGLAAHHVPTLVTHGWMVTRDAAREVWGAGLAAAAVPLSAADSSSHDARVGLVGAHGRALTALRTLAETRQEPWQTVSVRMALGETGGVDEVERLLSLVDPLRVRVEVESRPATAADGRGISGALIELKRVRSNLASSGAYLGRVSEALGQGVPGCQAGRRSFHVDYRGRVWRCSDLDASVEDVGGLLELSPSELLARLRDRSASDGCRRCWRADRGEIESLYTWRGLREALPAWLWR
jgi:MoaA/NifB/PqqE/SkfB family radical SAM enzyme